MKRTVYFTTLSPPYPEYIRKSLGGPWFYQENYQHIVKYDPDSEHYRHRVEITEVPDEIWAAFVYLRLGGAE